jgi:hypothetical protein
MKIFSLLEFPNTPLAAKYFSLLVIEVISFLEPLNIQIQ